MKKELHELDRESYCSVEGRVGTMDKQKLNKLYLEGLRVLIEDIGYLEKRLEQCEGHLCFILANASRMLSVAESACSCTNLERINEVIIDGRPGTTVKCKDCGNTIAQTSDF